MNSLYAPRSKSVQVLHPSSLLLHSSPSSSPTSHLSPTNHHRRAFSRRRRAPLHIGTMAADPVSLLSFALAVTFSVGLLVLLCSKQVEKQSATSKHTHMVPIVDDSDLDNVEPRRRQVERADEILAGKKGNKHEYMTMRQLEPSESFNKSIGVPS
ncbi:hypothetical protein PFISCL1PPCAC_22024, partial [Pristionchus fissidentatus]